jgi:hypothetical protein
MAPEASAAPQPWLAWLSPMLPPTYDWAKAEPLAREIRATAPAIKVFFTSNPHQQSTPKSDEEILGWGFPEKAEKVGQEQHKTVNLW